MEIRKLAEITKLPELRELTPEEQADVYRVAKAAFTAEDLQRFTELDEGFDMGELLIRLEGKQKAYDEAKP